MTKIAIVLDTRRIKKDGTFPVKLRVTFERKQRYYPTPHHLTEKAFRRTMFSERLTDPEKELKKAITFYDNKAGEIVKALPLFTWEAFEKQYLANRAAKDTIYSAFSERIMELRQARQIGTAASYECAQNSINKFAADAKFADITLEKLNDYEKWMLENGSSKTTISMYLRSLRAIFNKAISDNAILPALYPFRRNQNEKSKYQLPEGRNIKKALTIAEIEKIFNYKVPGGTPREMAKDFWIFIYLSNGMNVKDMCLLKQKDIDTDTLTFIRAKTVRQKKEKIIQVVLQPETKVIIEKWATKKKDENSLLFPILTGKETPERQRQLINQLTHVINSHMKTIGKDLNIAKSLTTYSARHSFATVLKRSGTSIALISEMLGHSNLKTTQSYLDSFENEALKEQTKALTAFDKGITKNISKKEVESILPHSVSLEYTEA